MDKKLSKTILNAVVSMFVILILLFCSAAISFGWFSNNRDVNGGSAQVGVDQIPIGGTFSLYAYDLNKQQATNNKVVKNSSGNDETILNSLSDFDLNTHDAIFEELNDYTTILIQIDLYGKTISTNNTGTIKLTINRNKGETTNSKLTDEVTNILTFTLLEHDEISPLTTINEKWEKAKDLIENNNIIETKMFISYANSTYTVKDKIELSFNYTASDIYTKNGTKFVTTYLAIDYSEEYTLKRIQQAESDLGEDYSASNIIPIQNDLSDISLSFVQ